jgi:uncharacterized membrane protein
MKKWLIFAIILVLTVGISFRFTNLGKKAYWRDEVATSLRVAGYTVPKVIEEAYDGKIRKVSDLHQYQSPSLDKGLTDTLHSLAIEDSQHPPLYYIIARFWAKQLGNSPAIMRSLSALISLLTFPCFYWLCVELFESRFAGFIGIALTSVSLFHVIYAQEAREYSLWTVTILFSSAALLRAIRLKNKLSWAIYTASIILSLYTYLLTGLVLIGQGIYVIIGERFKLNKTVISYLIAAFIGVLIFLPWLSIVITNASSIETTTSWLTADVSLNYLVKNWMTNFSQIFVTARPRTTILILLLIAYSMFFVCFRASTRIWLFILILVGSTAIPLVAIDLILGFRISAIQRYLIPSYLGVQLAVTYLFFSQINSNSSRNIWIKRGWIIIMLGLVFAGSVSCVRFIKSEKGWNKHDFKNIPVAHIINQNSSPLIISEAVGGKKVDSIGSLFSLSYLLNSEVNLLLFNSSKASEIIEKIPDYIQSFPDIYLFNISHAFISELMTKTKENYEFKKFYVDTRGDTLIPLLDSDTRHGTLLPLLKIEPTDNGKNNKL